MRTIRLLLLLLLAGLLAGCNPIKDAGQSSTGRLLLEEDRVEHGPDEDGLTQLVDPVDLYPNILVRVLEMGRALLDLGDQMQLRLWNDTAVQALTLVTADGVPLDVQMFLEEGGFTGRLATTDGGQAVFRTPGDVAITVLGTEFFVLYDPVSGQTAVGNFGGTIEVVADGRSLTLPGGQFVLLPGGHFLPLTLTLPQFEALVAGQRSPIQAVAVLITGLNEGSSTPTATLPPTGTPTFTATPTASPTSTPSPSPTPCGPPANWPVIIVQRGDTLGRLAAATGTTVGRLMLANCLESDRIYAGQRLWVPRLPPTRTRPPTRTPTRPPTRTPTVPPTPTATDTPYAPIEKTDPLNFSLNVSWQLDQANPAEAIASVVIDPTGGDPPYRFFHGRVEQHGAAFSYRWPACEPNQTTFAVVSGDGQRATQPYNGRPPCPSPTDTPTPPVACQPLAAYLNAQLDPGSNTVALAWDASGGCDPYNGTISAAYVGEAPYATYQLGAGGAIVDQPPARCGTFGVVYTLLLYDGAGNQASATDRVTVTWICEG